MRQDLESCADGTPELQRVVPDMRINETAADKPLRNQNKLVLTPTFRMTPQLVED